MAGYVRSVEVVTSFEGNPVKAVIAPLSFGDFIRVRGCDSEDAAVILLAEVLPKYVTEFEGPLDAKGEPVPLEEVCANAYFHELTSELCQSLASTARPKDPSQPSEPSAA